MYQKKYRYRKEIGIEKMYQIRYRKKLVSEKVSDSVSFRFCVLSHTVPGTLADIALLCSFLYKNPNVNKLK